MAGPFFFAWVDHPAETTETETSAFLPEYAREDEEIFSVLLTHEEGEFPYLRVTVRNPRIGLLAPGRKRWAWLSYQSGEEVKPLFFGRLVGIPASIQGEAVDLEFVAKPIDYEEQRADVADAMRVAPFYDPVLWTKEDRENPDRVLEGYGALWHIDRVTHEVTASDNITGEDGVFALDEDQGFYDIADISISGTPVRKCIVKAHCSWEQRAYGAVNITPRLIFAFNETRPLDAADVNGNPLPWEGDNVYLMGAEGMEQAWPKPGTSLGGGWEIFESAFNVVGVTPRGSIMIGPANMGSTVAPQGGAPGRGLIISIGWPNDIVSAPTYGIGEDEGRHILWIPIVPFSPYMSLFWRSEREYTEDLNFTLSADVQDVLSDPQDEDTVTLEIPDFRVDALVATGDYPIQDARRRAYFTTVRGRRTVSAIIARARALLLSRARVVEIRVGCDFDLALDLSCRMSALVTDYRFPGGQIAGKISGYSLTFDGDSGARGAEITVSSCVGKGGTITEVEGEPTYAEEDYTGNEYQLYDGQTVIPIAGQVSYVLSSLVGTRPNDDGKSLFRVGRSFIKSLVVQGGVEEQQEALGEADTILEGGWGGGVETSLSSLTSSETNSARTALTATNVDEVKTKLSSVITKVTLEMHPIEGGPFTTTYNLQVSDLKIPQTIDLEASA